MAEYYSFIPVGSIILFICMLVLCCRQACDNKRSRPPPQGQVYVIPGSGVQNTQYKIHGPKMTSLPIKLHSSDQADS